MGLQNRAATLRAINTPAHLRVFRVIDDNALSSTGAAIQSSRPDQMTTSPDPLPPIRPAADAAGAWRATRLSVAFVIGALLILLTVPPLLQRRIDQSRNQITQLAESARDLTED